MASQRAICNVIFPCSLDDQEQKQTHRSKIFQIPSCNKFSSLKYALSDSLTIRPEDLQLYPLNSSTLIPDDASFADPEYAECTEIVCRTRTFSFQRKDPLPVLVRIRNELYPEMEFLLDELHTVKDLKMFVGETVAAFHDHSIIAEFEGKPLDDELLLVSLPSSSKPRQIFLSIVQNVDSGLIRIRVVPLDLVPKWISLSSECTVLQLKRHIASIFPEYSIATQRIIHAGYAVLDNEKRLNQTSIVNGSEIHIVKSTPPPPPTIVPPTAPAGMMIGTINIDVPTTGPIDNANIQSIMANVARSLTESLLPQIRDISSNPSAQSELDQGSLFRIEVDSIEGEYREFLQLLGRSPPDFTSITSHVQKLGVILRELSQSSPLLYQRLESMSISAEANENYSFQPGEDTEHLIKVISKYVKLFESILAVCRAFKFEDGRVTFQFPSSRPSSGGGIRMSTPQIYNFPSALQGSGLKQCLLQLFSRASPEARRKSLRSFFGVPVHPLLGVVFDSLRISDLVNLLGTGPAAEEALKGVLVPLSLLLKRCILRGRPLNSSLDGEASFLWDFFVSSFDSPADLEQFRSNFVNFFHSIVDHVFDFSARLDNASGAIEQEQVKRQFSVESLRLLRSIGQVMEAFAKNHVDSTLKTVQIVISQCSWVNRLWGKWLLGSFIGNESAFVASAHHDTERSRDETGQKRRRIDSDHLNDQLKAFVEASTDGYFDVE